MRYPLSAAVLTFLLAIGCASQTTVQPEASTETAPAATEEKEETPETSTDSENDPSKLDVVGDVADTEAGRMELIKLLEINETVTSGPFNITIKNISVVNLEPLEEVKSTFEGKDRVTLVGISLIVENTSEDTVSIYPEQGTIVVNQEQKNGDIWLSDQIGGDFIGTVVKEGTAIFVLDALPEDVTTVKYVIQAPHNNELTQIGDELTLEYEL